MLFAHTPLCALIFWVYIVIGLPVTLIACLILAGLQRLKACLRLFVASMIIFGLLLLLAMRQSGVI